MDSEVTCKRYKFKPVRRSVYVRRPGGYLFNRSFAARRYQICEISIAPPGVFWLPVIPDELDWKDDPTRKGVFLPI
jgi:hypothetical protein